MRKFNVKKNEEVVVLAGTARGHRGRVLQVLHQQERVIVEGAKMIKRHTRKSQAHPQGAIVEREGTIHLSNVMPAAEFDRRAAKRAAAAPAPAPAS
jgi:large subunit ribosomal protein L24